ncbi:MAG TPA: response regulator [Oligoflexus sp.]|uniref:response regulator n=1 Tax=Oligoflexus sp. TaxID=1971216 RepID=UPI002D270D3D|nr:response regulator [Oligoflexus sp.]HYX33411.1 response regulator [Oligoflexus sp.]
MSQSNSLAKRRVILIDDDRSFGLIMKQCALQHGIELDYFESLADLGFVALVGRYDVAILDYDLGNMTGVEIGEYLSVLFDRMPMLLISGTMRTPGPEEIKAGLVRPFMHKNKGYDLILSTALELSSSKTLTSQSGSGSIGLGVM